jgi:hypothetical protein
MTSIFGLRRNLRDASAMTYLGVSVLSRNGMTAEINLCSLTFDEEREGFFRRIPHDCFGRLMPVV